MTSGNKKRDAKLSHEHYRNNTLNCLWVKLQAFHFYEFLSDPRTYIDEIIPRL
jgi:hypothetical protein